MGVKGGIDTRLSSTENQTDTFKAVGARKSLWLLNKAIKGLGKTRPLEDEDRQFGTHHQWDNTPKFNLTAL